MAGGFRCSRATMLLSSAPAVTVTRAKPSVGEMADMLFAMKIAKHVKSNAIVLAKRWCDSRDRGGADVAGRFQPDGDRQGQGGGACRRSRSVAERSAVVASDAFFPFPDGLLAAVAGGARAVIQPGGSVRDGEVIAAADAADCMVFMDLRHFRH